MRLAVLGVLGLVLGGCAFINDFDGYTFDGGGLGDGGSGDGGPDTTPPTVVSTSPDRDGFLLDGRAPVRITFDGPVVAEASDVALLRDTVQNVPGSLAVDGDTLIFTPDAPLAQFGDYQVTVAGSVTDAAGNPLGEPYVFPFEVPATGRGDVPAVRVDTVGAGGVTCPELVMDASGNAMVLFAKGAAIYTAYYRAGVGFGPTTKLADGKQATIGISPGGRMAVAYTGVVSGVDRVLVRVSGLADPTFGMPELADEGFVRPVRDVSQCDLGHHGKNIAVNDAGNVVVAWRTYQDTGLDPFIGVSRNVRTPAGAWATRVDFSTNPALTELDRMGVAVDATGNAQVVLAYDAFGGAYNVFRKSIASGSWSAPASLEASGIVTAPRLEISPAGAYTLAYAVNDGMARMFITSQTFAGMTTLTQFNGIVGLNATQLHLSVRHGLWAAWVNNSGIGIARRAGNDGVWEQGLIAAVSAPNASYPMIAGRGATKDAIVVWERQGMDVRWTTIVPDGVGLPVAGAISTLPTEGTAATSPRVVYDATSGHGLATWLETHPTGVELHATQFHNFPPAE